MPRRAPSLKGSQEIVIEDAAARSMARFGQIVESAPSAMVMVDRAGSIELVNAEAERIFGYARSELLGRSIEILIPERFRGSHGELRDAFLSHGKSRPMGAGREILGLRKDGSEFPLEIGLNLIETDAGPMVLSAIIDITERRRREAAIRSALREKDVLLGEIHHRVKNNLQIIQSLLDMQSVKTADRVALELLRESQNRVRSMALIHQTLYQSKDLARVDFGSFLESLIPALLSSYGVNSEHVAVVTRAGGVTLPLDAAVPCGLAVNELISNALKHAFPGGRRGEIRIDLTYGDAGQIVLSVADDGIGLPEGFDSAEPATLGLQLVILLADQLGGGLCVETSKPTRFTLRFPAAT